MQVNKLLKIIIIIHYLKWVFLVVDKKIIVLIKVLFKRFLGKEKEYEQFKFILLKLLLLTKKQTDKQL